MSNNKKSPLLDLIDDITSFPTEGLTMEERAGLVKALKNKLKSIGGSESGVLDNLKPAGRKRSELLTDLKSEHDAIEASCQMLYAPLYSKTEHDEIEANFYEERVGLEEKYKKRDEIEAKYLEERAELNAKYQRLYAELYSKMSYTGIMEMLILWDYNNLPLGYEKIQFLRKILLEKFPGIKLRIKAYANQISPAQLHDCEGVASVTLVSSVRGEADRAIMVDLFEYVYDHPSPNWVMVISTDGDFSGCLSTVTKVLQYGTILVCDTALASERLKKSVQYYYDWNNLEEISEELEAPPAEVCLDRAKYCWEMRSAKRSNQTCVFWNIEALPAPSDMHQDDGIRILMEQLIQPHILELKPVEFRIYGEKGLSLPPYFFQAKKGNVSYINARNDPHEKARSTENMMLRDIMLYAFQNSLPSNIFIIDNNVNLKSPILALTSRGFKVFLVGAPDVSRIRNKDTKQTSQHHLREAASLCLDFPDFTGCYTPVEIGPLI